jgi:hypothetical protein
MGSKGTPKAGGIQKCIFLDMHNGININTKYWYLSKYRSNHRNDNNGGSTWNVELAGM